MEVDGDGGNSGRHWRCWCWLPLQRIFPRWTSSGSAAAAVQPSANGNRLGKEDRRRRDGEKRRVKANKRPRARVEDKTGARLGEGRRTEKDEGPLKNKNKRNRVKEGECHCDRRGGLQRDARQKKKKIERGKGEAERKKERWK